MACGGAESKSSELSQRAERGGRDACDFGSVTGGGSDACDEKVGGAASGDGAGETSKAGASGAAAGESLSASAMSGGAAAAAYSRVDAEDGGTMMRVMYPFRNNAHGSCDVPSMQTNRFNATHDHGVVRPNELGQTASATGWHNPIANHGIANPYHGYQQITPTHVIS